jgi:hypothetical protein
VAIRARDLLIGILPFIEHRIEIENYSVIRLTKIRCHNPPFNLEPSFFKRLIAERTMYFFIGHPYITHLSTPLPLKIRM